MSYSSVFICELIIIIVFIKKKNECEHAICCLRTRKEPKQCFYRSNKCSRNSKL